MEKSRILLVSLDASSFVEQDARILQSRFDVDRFRWTGFRDAVGLRRAMNGAEAVVCWFAEVHSALAAYYGRRKRKATIAVVGGYDVAAVPEISYGVFTRMAPFPTFTRYGLRNSRVLLPVSEWTRTEIGRRTKPRGTVETLYNAVDTNKFLPGPRKEPMVLTVGAFNAPSARRKGLDTVFRAARRLTRVKFVIAGNVQEGAQAVAGAVPPNVELTGQLDDAQLVNLMAKARVYAQLSVYESFGVALAEAMSAGAVPVATDAAALPEVVGDTGFLVPVGDVDATVGALEQALEAPDSMGQRARRRVQEKFDLSIRARRLPQIVREAIDAAGP